MRRYWYLSSLVVLLLAATPFAWRWLTSSPTTKLHDDVPNFLETPSIEELYKSLGGDDVVSILKRPDRVEAALVAPPGDVEGLPAHEHKVASEKRTVGEAVTKDITEILTTPELHRGINATTLCLPVYGARVSYFPGENRVDLYFCFGCDDLAVYLNEKGVGGIKFFLVCKRLLHNVLEVFPDDEKLKKTLGDCSG